MNLKAELNQKQYIAASTIDGPLLIIAGAGSGKTRVITFRIAHMLEMGIPQSQILALTFTNKAAREMAERVRELTGKKLPQLTVSTFHAFGVKVLRDTISSIGYKDNFSIYDTVDQISLLKESAREIRFDMEDENPQNILGIFSRIKTKRGDWDEVTSYYQGLYASYQRHLKLYNAVDFDDLIMLPIHILDTHPEILNRYTERYRYIMVDEFQDTSMGQYRFMKLLADGSRNICVVGDDDQSIYSWRGANYENIISFERDYPELKEVKLEQNYRSTETILEAANTLIANNTNRKGKQLWTGTKSMNKIEIAYPANERDEAQFIAEQIKGIHMRDSIKFGEFGVLIRTNTLSRAIEELFLMENIPYKMSGGTSFYQRKEIKDMICYMRILANPEDDVSLLRILNVPRRGIGARTLEQLRSLADMHDWSLHTAIQAAVYATDSPFSERAKTDLRSFLQLIEAFRPKILSPRKIASTLKELTDAIDYWEYLLQEHPKDEKIPTWKWRNIEIFIQSIEDYEKNPDNMNPSLFNYLNRISLTTKDEPDDDEGKVNLMTIHSAKGLEHEVVFLAGVESHIIPHARAIEDDPANIEEERRLFYVAITRAKQRLIMTSCRSRKVLREEMECLPSPFLEELPQHLLQETEAAADVEAAEATDYFQLLRKKLGGV
ncbi:ATP-dependent helicase [Spirochaeta africana]|uniref:DNA 3'-5' helicase n=1 Tax=Spirochaeta africana (strain ATCC 700263 / DSM 8902 / Z-7692) TaxID=889378 RepID=H9UHC8_SPIAZ|nr:UvrD-helicase domain-containing protein [Spirochaeta africana]AFG36921.1 DNA/RNA helicase, superfamily I [Spirochaeta africana DSM 8902]